VKPAPTPRPSAETALVSLAVALLLTLIAFMAALPARHCAQAPDCAQCAEEEAPDFYSLPVVVVAFANRFDSAAAVGIGVEQAPFAQR
jgi:hypothetical protein